jgi:hypothetical protein
VRRSGTCLTPGESWKPRQRLLREFYRELIRLRGSTPDKKKIDQAQKLFTDYFKDRQKDVDDVVKTVDELD